MWSPAAPESVANATVTVGAILSSAKTIVLVPTLPARSVSVAIKVCVPSASVGATDQAPPAPPVPVPTTTPFLVSVTVVLASPEPWMVGSLVNPSVVLAPVSCTRDTAAAVCAASRTSANSTETSSVATAGVPANVRISVVAVATKLPE